MQTATPLRSGGRIRTLPSMVFERLRETAERRNPATKPTRPTVRPAHSVAPASRTRTLRVALALGTLYLVWGSTYLAAEFVLPAIPPFLIAGLRFSLCGALLYPVIRAMGAVRPTRAHWITAGASGLLMILGGNALVFVAQQRITSSLAALLVATVPLFMALFGWIAGMRGRPLRVELALLALGLVGLGIILRPSQTADNPAAPGGALLVLFAAACWAIGSLVARTREAHPSPMLFAAMQMVAAGPVLLGIATLTGETDRIVFDALTPAALGAFGYLTLFGSFAGFCVYVWLVRNAEPVAATSYAYVNPVVAIALGSAILDEPIPPGMIAGGALVLTSVALLLTGFGRGKSQPTPAPRRAGSPAIQPTSARNATAP